MVNISAGTNASAAVKGSTDQSTVNNGQCKPQEYGTRVCNDCKSISIILIINTTHN